MPTVRKTFAHALSRTTVRQALSRLEQRGLIERLKGQEPRLTRLWRSAIPTSRSTAACASGPE